MSTGDADPFRVVIPARLSSARLPRKPLRPLGGKPLILRVHDAALRSGAEEVVVATDSEEIAGCVRDAGGRAQMTSPGCATGSDRIAEAVTTLRWPADTIVVNIQGDEPFLCPRDVQTVAAALTRFPDAVMSTLAAPLEPGHEDDPNVVKLVTNERGMALRFSRAPLGAGSRRHLGVYACRCAYLRRFTSLPVPDAERRERLEQLRVLRNGDLIRVDEAVSEVILGIDTEDDLRAAERLLDNHGHSG